MPILFDVVFLLYSLVYFPYLFLTGRWHPDYIQRFGFFTPALRARLGGGRNVWVHAVSVGEVMAVEGVIARIKARWPSYTIVCSVTTKTGYALAQKRLGNAACVICAPLDLSLVVHSFAAIIRPKLYIAAETELWPNLFSRLHKDKVPIVVINGRISDRSIGRYRMIKALLKGILAKVDVFAMQSDLDAARIKELGADPGKVFTVGNIKFDQVRQDDARPQAIFSRPLWVAGSTHPGEELLVLDVFKKMSGWSMVIAPRHVERAAEVMDAVVSQGFEAVKFSELQGDPGNKVIVVDAIGHLRGLYAAASLVFVGKSLCGGGGQNIIEPAVCAKPIIIGPMMENFKEITACFKAEDALVQVDGPAAFEKAVLALAADEGRRRTLGQKAMAVVDKNQGAGERTLELIKQWL